MLHKYAMRMHHNMQPGRTQLCRISVSISKGHCFAPMQRARPCAPHGGRASASNWRALMPDAKEDWLRRACRFRSARAATALRLVRSLSLSSPWRPCSSSRPMVWPCAVPRYYVKQSTMCTLAICSVLPCFLHHALCGNELLATWQHLCLSAGVR